ncbi:MAG: hypothetical protein U0835_16390 [Isosphaeraceae bacterium]
MNKNVVYDVPANGILRRAAGAKGVSAAGAKVFNPVKEDYRVSVAPGGDKGNQAANDAQKGRLQDLVLDAKAINAAAREGPKSVKTTQDIFVDDLKNAEKSGDFKEIPKAPGTDLVAKTNQLLNASPLEAAQAEARQTLTKSNNSDTSPIQYKPTTNLTAEVGEGAKDGPMPMAVAVGFNFDPLGVAWDGPAALRIEFQGLALTATSLDPLSSAVALISDGASYLNGTSDIEAPVLGSSPLFDLTLSAFSSGGGPVDFVLDLETYGNPVSDSAGNTGEAAVLQALLDRLVITPTSVGLPTDYSIMVGLPGSPSESVLYLRDSAAASATSVPEPSVPVLASALATLAATLHLCGKMNKTRHNR